MSILFFIISALMFWMGFGIIVYFDITLREITFTEYLLLFIASGIFAIAGVLA